MEFKHQPVLVKEVLESIPNKKQLIFVDGTLGGGGHTLAVIDKLTIQGVNFIIIGIDRDLEAVFAAKKNLSMYGDKVIVCHDNYSNMTKILKSQGIDEVDFILLDLGISSYQIDNPKRGFTFQTNSPLDMRMNQKDQRTAADIVNSYSEKELADIFYRYGGERNSRKIAQNIVKQRQKKSLETTSELSEIIIKSFPVNYSGKYKIHPATRVFQALRIEVNDELNILQEFIPQGAKLLSRHGRLAIISFHSGEDRIVKHTFRKLATNYPEKYKVVSKKPIIPSREEMTSNPRSRSAKLRVLEKI